MDAWAPAVVDEVVDEVEVARKLQLVCTFRRAVFPSDILDNNSELAFRASSTIAKLAYHLHLKDNVKKLAEAGNAEAIEFLRTEPR